ncbi:MAG: trypsin-like peptidase domain-containing protein [Candidatus Peribacteraceae bacterium]|jgi:serine protease Do
MKPLTSRLLFTIGTVSLAASLLIVSVGNAEWSFWNPFAGSASSSSSVAEGQLPAPPSLPGLLPSSNEEQTVSVVEKAEPAVVSVIITEELPVIEREMQTIPSPFGDFFGGTELQVPRYVQRGTQKQEVGGGTAFFVTEDGLLLTNKHVVEDDKAEYTVLLNDGRKLPATAVARDATNDIALLKVQGSGFTPLTVAPDDQLRLGQTAIAIGNALGEFRNTVSVGVVSGLQRSITAGGAPGGAVEQLEEIIQTDAAINRGNSGGPLLNSRGEVIGMSTAVAASAQNIGFAIPAAELRRVVASYLQYGRIVRPYLGVRYAPVTEEVKRKNNITYDYGALVVRGETAEDMAVLPGSPADKAGLKEGDIILEVDGKKLLPTVSLLRLIQTKAPGDKITLKVSRAGKELAVTVTVEEWKE